MEELSGTAQDYLKTIYCLEKETGGVTVSRLAEAMGVSLPSVTSMVKKLAVRKLLDYTPYLSVTLIPERGEARAGAGPPPSSSGVIPAKSPGGGAGPAA